MKWAPRRVTGGYEDRDMPAQLHNISEFVYGGQVKAMPDSKTSRMPSGLTTSFTRKMTLGLYSVVDA